MSLSSLIVQREVATMRQVEEALARQVIYGGDLVTNLLEVARVDESVLIGLLAESMRIPPGPAGELPPAADAVRLLVPQEVAVERTVVPLDVDLEGRLVLAVAEPMPPELVEQLRFALGMTVEQRAAPAVRVQQAVSKAYGVPLERRMARLIARLAGETVGPNTLPPGREAPPASPAVAGRPSAAHVVGRLSPKATAHSKTSPGFPVARIAAEAAPEGATAAATAGAAQPKVALSPAATVQRPSAAPGTLLQREVTAGPRVVRRRRGPITAETAKAEAEEAADRDTLLDLFFDFSKQFFDYSALFLVHADIAEGRDAFGSGVPRERVLGIGVPLDMPSMLSSVRERRVPTVGRASPESLDAVLLGDLHRPRDAEMAVVPLVVRTRAVAILIGDCGEAGIDREAVQQVVAMSGMVGKAFERIIVRRKLDGFMAGGVGQGEGRVASAAVASKPSRALAAAQAAAPAALSADEPVAHRTVSEPPVVRLPPSDPPERSPGPLPLVTKRAASTGAPGSAGALPPPAANVAVVRKIGGPPIPREEPETPGVVRGSVRAGSPRPSHSPPPPEVELSSDPAGQDSSDDLELEVKGTVDADASRALFDELGWGPEQDPVSSETPPLASNAIAVAPHRPPAPVPLPAELPSVIVEDLDRELVAMVDRLASGEVDEVAEGELLRQGERAMRAIMSRFPGPIAFSRARIATANSPPRASECGPILRLIARERRVALPFVLDRLAANDVEERGWATHLVCELPYIEAIPRLLPRLRDADASTSVSAAHALSAIARASPEPVRDALVHLARAAVPDDRVAALRAMAKLRDGSFVPELVHALGDDEDSVVEAAHDALVQLTRQDLGTDARPWLKWWEQNSTKHRIEWLIDALVHDVAEIRKSAAEELRSLTKEYFGYAGDLPPRDRDRAQQRYRDWWLMEGRGRFRSA